MTDGMRHRVTVARTEPGGSWEARCRDCRFVEYGSTRKVARDEARYHKDEQREVSTDGEG